MGVPDTASRRFWVVPFRLAAASLGRPMILAGRHFIVTRPWPGRRSSENVVNPLNCNDMYHYRMHPDPAVWS